MTLYARLARIWLPVLVLVWVNSASGQSTEDGPDHHSRADGAASGAVEASAEFIDKAREATNRFHDLHAAIGAGYRLVGPDFPGMGEHWVNIRIAMDREIDPARPAVLSYLRVEGKPLLTGVAYAAPLLHGESPPDLPFPVTWHYHDGSIADEMLHLNPRASMKMGSVDGGGTAEAAEGAASRKAGPRLAMIHAWIWTPNPAGLFVQQNWELSRLRLGLNAARAIGPDDGKALFLLTGGVDYFQTVIERAAVLSSGEKAGVGELLADYRDRVAALIPEKNAALTTGQLDEAGRLWRDLWAELEKVAPDAMETLSGGH